jgi:hypothetical protein
MLRKVLLVCGILSSLLYVGATIPGALQWKGYDWTTRSVSELFALDAPSRPLVATAFLVYGPLMIAFGVGVWMSGGHKRSLRILGGLLIGYALVGLPGPLFFSMHTMVRGGGAQGMAPSDVMHIILTAALVLLILFSSALGSGRRHSARLSVSTPSGPFWSSSCLALWQVYRVARWQPTCRRPGWGGGAPQHLWLHALGGGTGHRCSPRPRRQRAKTPVELIHDSAGHSTADAAGERISRDTSLMPLALGVRSGRSVWQTWSA